MGEVQDQIAKEETRQLAALRARQEVRATIQLVRETNWRREIEFRDAVSELRRAAREHLCGAKTRTGKPCQRRGNGAGGRCPNHGGMSTGPRTQAGRQRIAEAQRRRWAQRRDSDENEQSVPILAV